MREQELEQWIDVCECTCFFCGEDKAGFAGIQCMNCGSELVDVCEYCEAPIFHHPDHGQEDHECYGVLGDEYQNEMVEDLYR